MRRSLLKLSASKLSAGMLSACLLSACLLGAIALVGCNDTGSKLRVGVKSFTEQRIVGEMVRARLQAGRLPVDRLVECGTTAGCQQAIAAGRVDVLIEYTGTAAAFAAAPGVSDFDSIAKVMGTRGQTWLTPLGFDNGYRVLVTPQMAETLKSIDDLARIKPLRVIAPAEFLQRPRDGLGALATRYGLTLTARPLLIESPVERFAALRDGRGDVAIGYATDGAIDDFQLVTLDDSAAFFPRYDAALVVRTARKTARIEAALKPLAKRISTSAMRRLNAAVELEGMQPAAVARRFLMQKDLLKAEGAIDKTAPPLVLASDALFAKTARKIVREAFPSRPVQVVDVDSRTAVRARARLVVLPADVLAQEKGMVATAVIGRSWLHAVRKTATGVTGRKGVEPTVGQALKKGAALIATAPELFEAVRNGQLDFALVRAPLNDPGITDAIGSGLVLVSLPISAPLHQRARIPAGTYTGQTEAIETWSTQVLLASPGLQRLAQASGPSGAVGGGAAPLTMAQRAAIVRAAGVPEVPDPALPRATTADTVTQGSGWLDGILNLLVVLFMAWWIKLVLAPIETKKTDAT
ncbi:MAG: osmoprotectant transport system substrate-binding protein [Bradymonadia bacterium]|jgi:osmoprotectant transport system substrate-binding protein